MTKQTKTEISNQLAAHIESLLDSIENAETEKAKIENELNSKLYEHKITLNAIEYWESTGLESDIDSLQRALARSEYQLTNLQGRLNDARLV
jgi:predicted RNase H-like nuclease (RuvC/YqgF family)